MPALYAATHALCAAVLYTSDLTAYSSMYLVEVGEFGELPDLVIAHSFPFLLCVLPQERCIMPCREAYLETTRTSADGQDRKHRTAHNGRYSDSRTLFFAGCGSLL